MSEEEELKQTIYHITTPETWERGVRSDRYAAPSLEAEGFIHCSLKEQVERSLNKFFRNEPSVMVLTIDPLLLDSELIYEPADGSRFPHIYGEIPLAAFTQIERIDRDPDGLFAYSPEQ